MDATMWCHLVILKHTPHGSSKEVDWGNPTWDGGGSSNLFLQSLTAMYACNSIEMVISYSSCLSKINIKEDMMSMGPTSPHQVCI